jgi:glycine dehydrogenase subunit 2
MLTNPSTLGMFEEKIEEICRLVHEAGGLVYMDGANMNALVGVTRPGDMGVDVIHLNLHKTFSTPHGGGGPGAGPIAVTERARAIPSLPACSSRQKAVEWRDRSAGSITIVRIRSAGCAHSTATSRCWCARSVTLSRSARTGLRLATETAVLNANYIAHHLKDDYEVAYAGKPMHEVVFTDKRQQAYRCPYARHRQAADRLRLPSDDGLLSADRSRRDHDRADRERGARGDRPLHRRD